MAQSAPACFCETYAQARALFVNAASPFADGLQFFAHPQSGEHEQQFGTDILCFGNQASANHIIICSATHGIEGYAGSAIQTHLLQGLFAHGAPNGIKITMIHALNPWGFAHGRRVSENNVDLNRNFVDHSNAAYPANAGYDELAEAINPANIDDASLAAATGKMREFVRLRGTDALQAAIGQGQYSHPKGCYFGGKAPEWSNILLRRQLANRCRNDERLIFIDIHTGLGPFGYGELIVEMAPDDPVYQRADQIWGGQVTSTQDGSSSSSPLAGTIDFAVMDAAPSAQVTPVTLEFGTVPTNDVFAALRDDNWLYAHGADASGAQAAAIKQAVRDAFYPNSDQWKQLVLERGVEVVRQAIDGLPA